jgi:hypothetical protein
VPWITVGNVFYSTKQLHHDNQDLEKATIEVSTCEKYLKQLRTKSTYKYLMKNITWIQIINSCEADSNIV